MNAAVSTTFADTNGAPSLLDAPSLTAASELCRQLGYDDSHAVAPTRGTPSLLLDEVIALTQTQPQIKSPECYAAVYLTQSPAGLRHNYFVWNGAVPASHLTWGKDEKKIRELMTSLFAIVVQGFRKGEDTKHERTNNDPQVRSQAVETGVPTNVEARVSPFLDAPSTSTALSIDISEPRIAAKDDEDGALMTAPTSVGSKPCPVQPSKSDHPVKSEPDVLEERRMSLRLARQSRAIALSRRYATPPLSSLETVQRRRWPPQYVSPTRSSSCVGNGRRQATPRLRSPMRFQKLRILGPKRSSSPEVVSVQSVRSQRANRRASGVSVQPFTLNTVKSKSSSRHRIIAPTPTPSILTPPTEPGSAASSSSVVTFHFFTADERLGAVPCTKKQCNTAIKFYGRALSAHKLVNRAFEESDLFGVNVLMEGQNWPMILLWNENEDFEAMMGIITSRMPTVDAMINVKVKCIVKT